MRRQGSGAASTSQISGDYAFQETRNPEVEIFFINYPQSSAPNSLSNTTVLFDVFRCAQGGRFQQELNEALAEAKRKYARFDAIDNAWPVGSLLQSGTRVIPVRPEEVCVVMV